MVRAWKARGRNPSRVRVPPPPPMFCPYASAAVPTMKYCETNLCSLVAAPANTWSNIFYIVVGIYLISISRKEKGLLLKLIGPLAIFCGLASGIYHATFSYVWQAFDNGAMFIFISLLLVFNLYRLKTKHISTKLLSGLFILLNIASISAFFYKKTLFGINVGITIFAVELIAVLTIEAILYAKAKAKYKLDNLLFAFGLLIVGWGIWWLDFLKIWCDPNIFHLINGHATWHILTALSFIFIYKFYKQFS
jgi:hypothetical protein